MDERIARTIRNIATLENLAQFEANAEARGALDEETQAAIQARTVELGRRLVAEKTGLDLSVLSPAEEKIVTAIGTYVGLMKRQGKPTPRTFQQIRNRGLVGAAEVAVSRPTQGYKTLADADLGDHSYEQIVLDHPDEFSARAQWFARRTLGHQNVSDKPPAKSADLTQSRTEALLRWLKDRAEANEGILPHYTNAQAAATLGMTDMHRYGRAYGNIVSRIDYACYVLGLPPLGLTADAPFDRAWNQGGRDWAFPVTNMQAAAQARRWSAADFDRALRESERLPGQAHISWEKVLSEEPRRVRNWADGLQSGADGQESDGATNEEKKGTRNPVWTRDELILALDLYLRFRESPPSKDSEEVIELSDFLNRMGRARAGTEDATFRNANGVYMKMMNFRRFDPDYTQGGRVGLVRGNKLEEGVWEEFNGDPVALTAAVATIRSGVVPTAANDAPYWVFVCNPKKWAIDKFLSAGIARDAWGVRPSDSERFAPGQLGIVRVGVDRRSVEERGGGPPIEPGIYALCEVESRAYPGSGANDGYWTPGSEREPGWPTVKVRYLRNYLNKPLSIERLKRELPGVSPLLLKGFQASSFPISAEDFRAIAGLLGEDEESLSDPDGSEAEGGSISDIEDKYKDASPEVKERVSKYIERGPVGAAVKKANGYKCQVCEALGRNPFGFKKKKGEYYVEAHHVTPVSSKEKGVLAASNVMTVCANHHRQIHYGNVVVTIEALDFVLVIDGQEITISRYQTKAIGERPTANVVAAE